LQSSRGQNDQERRALAGLVVGVRHGKTQRGRMGSVILDDRTGRIEVACFSELYEQVRGLLVADNILVVVGSLSFDDYRDGWSLRADEVRTLEQAREDLAHHIDLTLDLSEPAAHAKGQAVVGELRSILGTFRGAGLPIHIEYHRPGARGHLVLGSEWRARPTEELLKRLRQILGQEAVRVSYERGSVDGPAPGSASAPPRLALVR